MGPVTFAVGWWLIVAPGVASAACDAPTTARDLHAATTAFHASWAALDVAGVHTALDQADHALRCIDEPLVAPDVVTWFQLVGLAAFLDEDKTRARDAFRAALAVLPEYDLPSAVAGPDDDWTELYETLRGLPDEGRMALPAPEAGWIHVDGARATEHPTGRPWLFQQFDGSGRVVATQVVWTRQPPPAYVVPAPLEPVQQDPKRVDHTSRGLLIAGVAVGVAGAGGLGGAASLKAQFRQTADLTEAEKLKAPNLVLGSLGWAGVATGAGLATGAVVVGRW